jgi:hypothetical protein
MWVVRRGTRSRITETWPRVCLASMRECYAPFLFRLPGDDELPVVCVCSAR